MATSVENPRSQPTTLLPHLGLIVFDKRLIFFHVTNLSMMFWLVKDVVAYFSDIAL